MGNRAVITTPEKRLGMYLHWKLIPHDGDYSWNPNNYIDGKTCHIVPRK